MKKTLFLRELPFWSFIFLCFLLVVSNTTFSQTTNYCSTSGGTLSGNIWSTNPAGPYTSALNTTGGAILVFQGGTVTGATLTTVKEMRFTAATTWTAGGTISNAGTGTPTITIDVSPGVTQTLPQVFTSTTALTKTSTGALILTGANTHSGLTTISAGTLQYGITNALGTGAVTISGGTLSMITFSDTVGAVTLSGGGVISSTTGILTSTSYAMQDGTVSAILAGAVALTKTTAGTVTLSGVNTYSGTTTVSAGTLKYGANNAISTGAVTVSGGTLDLATFTDSVGTVQLTSGTITGTTGILTSTAAFDMQNGTVSAILAGGVGLNKTTSGTVILSGANTYSGTTTVSTGTLQYGANNAISTGAVTVSGGTLDLATFTDSVGTVQLTSGSITSTTGALTSTATYDMQSGTVSATLAGGVGLTKSTAGTVTLSGTNTFTGVTTITAGILSVATIGDGGVAGNLGQAANTASNLVLSGGTLQYTGSTASTNRNYTLTTATSSSIDVTTNTLTISGASTVTTGALTKIGSGTLILSGANGYTGLTTVSIGTLRYGANNAISTGAVTVSGGTLDLATFTDSVGTVQLTSGSITSTTGVLTSTTAFDMQSGTVSAILAGGVGLTKTTAGTVTLSGVNTYTGITTISAGTLSMATIGNGGVAGNLGAATNAAANLVLNGGTLQYTGANTSTDRNYTLNAGSTSTIDVTTNTLTISGASTVTTGALTKTGAGTLTLSGANGYTGLTTVSDGTLQYGANNTLSSGAVTVNGGTLAMLTFTDTVGAVTLSGGGLISGTTGVLTGTSYAMQDGTVSAILAGAVALTKTTAGTVTLSGVNTYTGITTISAGTLSVGTIGNGGTAGNLGQATNIAANLVLSGGTLKYTGATASSDRNYTLTAATTSTVEVTNSVTLTISGASTATTGALTKTGIGTLKLSGTNLNTGITTISAGTIELGAANAISGGSNIVMNGGTFSSGSGVGFGEAATKIGTITVTENSTINLGTGNHSVIFSASNSASWTSGKTLNISGWTGTAGASGTAGKLFSGAASSGLSSTQLAQITFTGYTGTAKILSTGEFVPFAACTTPTAQPTSLTLSSVTKTTLSGSFSAASPAPSKYLVVRSTSNIAPSPVNGTVYTAGTTLGTGEVIQASTSTSFTDSGLYAATKYYYYIFSYNDTCSGEPYYLTTASLTNNTTTLTPNYLYVDNGANTNDVYTAYKTDGVTAGIAGNDSTGDGTLNKPYATLNKAYSVATAGDVIYVDTGDYVSTTTPNVTFNKSDIQILGAGTAKTNFSSGSASGTVYWGAITANNLTFKYITIKQYDKASDGIAMTITSGSNILFDQCSIYNNYGSSGQGAVYIEGLSTEVSFRNCSLPCNRALTALYGGAMKICGSTVSLYNCSLNNNVISGLYGGAILITGYSPSGTWAGGANVTIDSCTFDANGANNGGAIAFYGDGGSGVSKYSGGTLTISNSCFDSGSTTDTAGSPIGGAAIYISGQQTLTFSLSNSSFTNNNSSGNGGALFFRQTGGTFTSTITTCSFSNNSGLNGEDIYFNTGSADLTLKNSTFSNYYVSGVNLYNNGMTGIKFEGLNSASGLGGCGDIVADGSGVAVTKPEMTGTYTESTTASPSSSPSPTCYDRFNGTCGAANVTFTCETTNTFGDISSTSCITGTTVTGITSTKNITNGGISRSGNTLTVNCTAHGFSVGNWVVIAGNSVNDYNRAYKIQSSTTNSFTVSVANITSQVTASSTSTVSGTASKGTTPIGWDRETIPTIYEHVIINYNYNTTTYGNIDACKMTVNSGKTLTVDNDDKNNTGIDTRGTYVNVINSIINSGTINVFTNGNLIQVNHPLDINSESIVTPTITLTKNTGNKVRWDYIYWSKPVTTASSIMSNFNTAFDIKYYWDPQYSININRNYDGWIDLSGEPTVGTGFIARVKTELGLTPAPISLNMAGESNNGDITAVVKYYDGNDQAFRNFTLLGNPYPGAIYFQDFYNDNSDKIYGTAYLWSSFTQYGGAGEYRDADYATFNLTGGVGTPATGDSVTPNGYIPSGQAFMVRPKVNGTITFKNAHRTKAIPSNNQFYRPIAPEDKNRFWLRLTDSNKRYSEQLIGYVDGSSTGFDEAYDGPINSLTKLKFYSFFENQKLIIQGNGDFNENDKLRIGYSKTMIQNELLTISISKSEGIFSYNTKVYLFDKELNQYHNLSNRPYQFIASTNSENRFEIIYQLPRNEDPTNGTNTVVASIDDNILSINADADIDSVILYDLTGKLILEKTITRNSNVLNIPIYVSSGVYITKVTLKNGGIFSNKLIKI